MHGWVQVDDVRRGRGGVEVSREPLEERDINYNVSPEVGGLEPLKHTVVLVLVVLVLVVLVLVVLGWIKTETKLLTWHQITGAVFAGNSGVSESSMTEY